ncbi:MAG: hypothetical protein R3D03_08150 [Geminicoccaceae bacterium]
MRRFLVGTLAVWFLAVLAIAGLIRCRLLGILRRREPATSPTIDADRRSSVIG